MVSRLRLLRPGGDTPPRSDVPDAVELVHRLNGGDTGAAVLVFRAYSVMVRGLIIRTLGPGNDVEDLVQDTFAVFFRKLPTLKEPGSLRSFLFGITIREIRGELRRRRVRRWLRLTSTGELDDHPAAGDENARHAFRRLHVVLESLDTREHLAFVLRHVESYELTEVAGALGCSLATVKRILAAVETRVWALAAGDPYLSPYIERKGG